MSQAMVRFNCPQCNKQFSAQAALAGKTLSCQCGAKVPIPTAGQASPPPSRSSQPSVSTQPTVTPRPAGYGSAPSTPPQPVPQPQYQPQAFGPTGGMQQPSKFCHACGQSIDARAEICPKCGVRQPGMVAEAGTANGKNRLVAALMALLLGGIGAHHFYLGRPILGVVYLLFCWTFIPAVVALIEGLVLLCTSDDAFNRAHSGQCPPFAMSHLHLRLQLTSRDDTTGARQPLSIFRARKLTVAAARTLAGHNYYARPQFAACTTRIEARSAHEMIFGQGLWPNCLRLFALTRSEKDGATGRRRSYRMICSI